MEELIIEAYKVSNVFGNDLGMELISAGEGKAHYKLVIDQKHMATPLNVHGGVIASLMDGTLGVAALAAVIDDMKVVSTVEFKINYLRPVMVNDTLTAHAEVIHNGKRTLVCDGSIFNQKGELVAKGMGTFNAYPAMKASLM